jgi:hypothetical protein
VRSLTGSATALRRPPWKQNRRLSVSDGLTISQGKQHFEDEYMTLTTERQVGHDGFAETMLRRWTASHPSALSFCGSSSIALLSRA